MSKLQHAAQYQEQRISARRANKQARRHTSWAIWAAGMATLRSILAEEQTQLQAIAIADARMDRFTPANWME
jgi:hypothetical protein